MNFNEFIDYIALHNITQYYKLDQIEIFMWYITKNIQIPFASKN